MIAEKNPLKWLIAFAIVFIVIIASWVWYNEYIYSSGEEIFLKTRPLDPRDILRGDYVILSYEFEQSPLLQNFLKQNSFSYGEILFLSFDENGELTWVSKEKSHWGITLEVPVYDTWYGYEISTGISQYFVPQGTGLEIEKVRGDMQVLVKINPRGEARIVSLYYQGKEIDPKTFIAPN